MTTDLAPPLTDAQCAVLLAHVNGWIGGVLVSEEHAIRRFIGGVLVEEAIRGRPVWPYQLAKRLVRDGGDDDDTRSRLAALRRHLDLMAARGDLTSRAEGRRRVLDATPQLHAKVRRTLQAQLLALQAALLAIEYLDGEKAA